MEGEVDDGHLDQVDIDEPCQPSVHKKLKKVDNPDDPEDCKEIDIDEDQNPFHIQVILDVLFNKLPFEEVKKFRFVLTTWNEVGLKELSRRPQKPIDFNDLEELENDNKLGELIKLQKSHDLFFPAHNHHQLFSKFSINFELLWNADDQVTSSIIFDNFFEIFKPSFVQLYGSPYLHVYYSKKEEKKSEEDRLARILCKFLIKISPTIQEIDFIGFYTGIMTKESVVDDVVEEMTRTRFPNLSKILNPLSRIGLREMFFYPIIGRNSPKLNHLSFGSYSFFGNEILTEELAQLKAQLETSGLLSKLKVLKLLNVKTEELDIFADFGQRGLLKLAKLNFKDDNFKSETVKDIFVRLIATQGDSLKILKITTSYQKTMDSPPNIRVPYPRLQNLTILQIDHFSSFQSFFEPINFSLQFPKLKEFSTFDFDTFYDQDFGKGGDSVKFVSFLNQQSAGGSYERHFDKIYEIFPNLEFLEVDIAFLPVAFQYEVEENAPFWSRLRKLRIHCKDFFNFDLHLKILKDVKKIEIMIDCGNTLALEDSYKNYISDQLNDGAGELDNYRLEKLYRKSLKSISEEFSSIIHVTSISITGYKISEDFKQDFRSIFPNCTFVSCRFKPPNYYL